MNAIDITLPEIDDGCIRHLKQGPYFLGQSKKGPGVIRCPSQQRESGHSSSQWNEWSWTTSYFKVIVVIGSLHWDESGHGPSHLGDSGHGPITLV